MLILQIISLLITATGALLGTLWDFRKDGRVTGVGIAAMILVVACFIASATILLVKDQQQRRAESRADEQRRQHRGSRLPGNARQRRSRRPRGLDDRGTIPLDAQQRATRRLPRRRDPARVPLLDVLGSGSAASFALQAIGRRSPPATSSTCATSSSSTCSCSPVPLSPSVTTQTPWSHARSPVPRDFPDSRP